MSLFPRTFAEDPITSFGPLFRLLDDFDNYSRGIGGHYHHRSHLKAFTPKFDVKETEQAYELYGELPGRTEHSFTEGTPPAGFVEELETSGMITEGGENETQKSHKDSTNTGTAVAKTDEGNKKSDYRYWVSERSVGEFSRSFSFPTRVDQDQVKASMKNGILSILVPKLKKAESRKIDIS
ncbi:HSP20-like chaperone [Rhexocercosporidium sp. MPI-PUGE-AT-0058]|nr:HSP20-like chaperone [Rhexocercosporidium sp. MPI-PUGE-AT-0058]